MKLGGLMTTNKIQSDLYNLNYYSWYTQPMLQTDIALHNLDDDLLQMLSDKY